MIIAGDIDLYSARHLKEQFISEHNAMIKKFLLNFQDVKYIDSTGIGILMYIFSESKKNNFLVYFSNVHGTVKKVIELTKLNKFLPITETEDMAMRLLRHEVIG